MPSRERELRVKAIGSIVTWFLLSWLTMLLLPYVTQGALTPGYWQVFWGMYIIAITAAFTKTWLKFEPE